MYLVISDYGLSYNSNNIYCSGKWLGVVKKDYPQYLDVKADEIEEILVYSSRGEDEFLFAKRVSCDHYIADENSLFIKYGEILSDCEETCSFIRRNVYSFLHKQDMVREGEYAPQVLFLESIQDYKYIRNGPPQSIAAQSLFDLLTAKFNNSDWAGIVNACPGMNNIEQTEIWNNPDCLGKLTISYGKLAARRIEHPTEKELLEKELFTSYFLKLSRRCIALDPYTSMHKSSLAFFLYDRYKQSGNDKDYEQAKILYEDLIESSSQKYRERYRYANLLRKHYEQPRNLYQADSYKELNVVLDQYSILIDGYNELSEKEKLDQRLNYARALYQYVTLQYDRYLARYWSIFFENQLFGVPFQDYLINNYAVKNIKKCMDYIKIVEGIIPNNPSAENVGEKPNYFDVYYREALLTISKGFLLRLRNYPEDSYLPFFRDASNKLGSLMEKAENLKRAGIRFDFPYYVKAQQAICMLFENRLDEIDRCFENKEYTWETIEQARILLLIGRKGEAVDMLRQIPGEDYNRKKADDLLAKLNEKV